MIDSGLIPATTAIGQSCASTNAAGSNKATALMSRHPRQNRRTHHRSRAGTSLAQWLIQRVEGSVHRWHVRNRCRPLRRTAVAPLSRHLASSDVVDVPGRLWATTAALTVDLRSAGEGVAARNHGGVSRTSRGEQWSGSDPAGQAACFARLSTPPNNVARRLSSFSLPGVYPAFPTRFTRNFGYHLGKVTARDFEPRVGELIVDTDLHVVADALLFG